jgi:hypothetical protein
MLTQIRVLGIKILLTGPLKGKSVASNSLIDEASVFLSLGIKGGEIGAYIMFINSRLGLEGCKICMPRD